MSKIAEACHVLEQIELADGSNAKLALLKQHDTPELRFLLETALNPFLNYGVHLDEDEHMAPEDASTFTLENLAVVRQALSSREVSGNDARIYLSQTCSHEDPIVRKWLFRVFNHNLRAGIAFGLVSKAFPGLLPSFDIALCCAISDEDVKAEKLPDGDWYISRKIDGVRCLAFVDESYNVVFYSRGGKALANLGEIEKQLQMLAKETGKANYVFDGELYSKSGTWNDTISIVHADVAERDQTSVLFLVFDMIKGDQWTARKTDSFRTRYADMQACFSKAEGLRLGNLKLLEHVPVRGYADAHALLKEYQTAGFEGAVLKNADLPYSFKRSAAFLKWKSVVTLDCKIVRVIEGRGKYKGTMGAIEIVTEDGKRSNCGSGFDDEQRDSIWARRDEMVGRMIEVEAQECTAGSIRFPIFVRFRTDRD